MRKIFLISILAFWAMDSLGADSVDERASRIEEQLIQINEQLARIEALLTEGSAKEPIQEFTSERQRATQPSTKALSAERQLIAAYIAMIQDTIASNWIQPPVVRNGVQVTVNVKLAPTGEIVSNRIVQASGDAQLDRSILKAIDQAGLRDLPNAVFEQNFRDFNLLFSSDDLIR